MIGPIHSLRIHRTGQVARSILLGAILLAVVVGAVWEFGITIAGYKNAILQLEKISAEKLLTVTSRMDVLKQLGGKTPESKFSMIDLRNEDNSKDIKFQRKDSYKWKRIIPGKKTMELIVNYERIELNVQDGKKPDDIADSDWVFKSFYRPEDAPKEVTITVKRKPKHVTLFEFLDQNIDGKISDDELVPESSIRKQMNLFDGNEDGLVSFEEFKAALSELEKEGPLTKEKEYEMVGGQSPGEGNSMPTNGGETFGGENQSRGTGNGFDPAALFNRMDENQDGKLSGTEIPERMKDRIDSMDTNNNGAIEREEFINRLPERPSGRRPAGTPPQEKADDPGSQKD